MANSITLSKNYTDLLDEVYKLSSLSTVLDSDATLARKGANANEILIPKIDMDGLADYSRNSGYVKGDVSLSWETVKFNYDRGRLFSVDYLDNEETIELAFGRLGSEFIRTRVVPEADAFTFAQLAGTTGISSTTGSFTTGQSVIEALRAGVNAMDEDEVPSDNRYLFITPTLYGMIQDLDTTKSKEVMSGFASVIKVPQSRFYTAITLKDGSTEGEEAGYYEKATDGENINFMIVHKPAVLKFDKHVTGNVIMPEDNQAADAYIQKYRKYGLVDVYANKVAGIYLNHQSTATE